MRQIETHRVARQGHPIAIEADQQIAGPRFDSHFPNTGHQQALDEICVLGEGRSHPPAAFTMAEDRPEAREAVVGQIEGGRHPDSPGQLDVDALALVLLEQRNHRCRRQGVVHRANEVGMSGAPDLHGVATWRQAFEDRPAVEPG
ncbi:MAG: hypothetical protein AAF657_19150 [Acidobacteriota bacterium]